MSTVVDADAYCIAETGQRVTALEFDLHLLLGQWAVVDRTDSVWTVRTLDGETLTLRPVTEAYTTDSKTEQS